MNQETIRPADNQNITPKAAAGSAAGYRASAVTMSTGNLTGSAAGYRTPAVTMSTGNITGPAAGYRAPAVARSTDNIAGSTVGYRAPTVTMSTGNIAGSAAVSPSATRPAAHPGCAKTFSGIGQGDFSEITGVEDFGDSGLYSAFFSLDERKQAPALIGIRRIAFTLGGRDAVSLFERRLKEEKKKKEKEERNEKEEKEAREKKSLGNTPSGTSAIISGRVYSGTIEGMTNYTKLPPGVSNLVCGSGWIAKDDGIIMECGKNGIATVCRHPVLIENILESLTTGEEKLTLLFRPADRWQRAVVDSDTIASASQITKLKKYGVSVTSENAHLMVRFLQDMEDYGKKKKQIPVLHTTSKLGWTANKSRFLPYDDAGLRFDGQPEFQKIAAHLKPHGDRKTWLDAYRKLRGIPMLDFLTAGSLAAPIVGMLENDGFVCNLYGESGTGKSVTNKIACSLWSGYTSREGFLFGADNKLNGIESILDVLNNLPLLLEDLNNMPESGQKSMQSMIMKIANGVGKARATKTMGIQRMKSWHTTALMTSENRVTKDFHNTGSVNRVLLCKAETYPYPGGPEKAGELLSVFENNYGFAGKEFVAALERMGKQGVKDAVQQAVEALTRYLNGKAGGSSPEGRIRKSSRQILPAAVMLTADRIAERYIFRDGKKITLKTAASWMADEDDANQYRRFYQALTDAVVMNIRNFERTDAPDESSSRTGYEYWGKYDEAKGYVYFLSSALEKLAENDNIDMRMFLDYLQRHGLFEPDKRSRTTVFHSRELNKSIRGLKIKMPQDMPQDTEDETDECLPDGEWALVGDGFTTDDIPFPKENTETPRKETAEESGNENPEKAERTPAEAGNAAVRNADTNNVAPDVNNEAVNTTEDGSDAPAARVSGAAAGTYVPEVISAHHQPEDISSSDTIEDISSSGTAEDISSSETDDIFQDSDLPLPWEDTDSLNLPFV